MSLIRPALVLFILLTLLTGGVYPLLTTSLGQWWFNPQANGSLIRLNGEVRGSALIRSRVPPPQAISRAARRPPRRRRIIPWPLAAATSPPATRRWIKR